VHDRLVSGGASSSSGLLKTHAGFRKASVCNALRHACKFSKRIACEQAVRLRYSGLIDYPTSDRFMRMSERLPQKDLAKTAKASAYVL
jgi:hypothetical protein